MPTPLKRRTLAEQLADRLKADILRGTWPPGDALPTEPELSEQHGVSRAVVRDATRILLAWGLVDVQHGRGVFVTQSQDAAFADALLLALQRDGATVWDVEQFEQMLFPAVVALAAEMATDEEIAQIRELSERYLAVYRAHAHEELPANTALTELRAAFLPYLAAVAHATHNKVMQRLAQPLLRLRNLRHWERPGISAQENIDLETSYVRALVDAIAARDPARARATVERLLALPDRAIEAMRATPVGEIPRIPPA